MDDRALISAWKMEEQQPFEGWNFSYLKGRHHQEALPWSYEQIVRDLLRGVDSVLDMGTGGGEKLLEFRDALPANTVATEGYAPNVPIARANLEPQGIHVVDYNIEVTPRMPFEDDTFPLIINRHESFDALEVARILRPGGIFLTQQVDGRDLDDMHAVFGHQSLLHLNVNPKQCSQGLSDAGLEVMRAEEWAGKSTFEDVGALVYFVRAVPWNVPSNFSVERYAPQLLALHRKGLPVVFTMRRFFIQARKPAYAS